METDDKYYKSAIKTIRDTIELDGKDKPDQDIYKDMNQWQRNKKKDD